jgi:hypothetical protein
MIMVLAIPVIGSVPTRASHRGYVSINPRMDTNMDGCVCSRLKEMIQLEYRQMGYAEVGSPSVYSRALWQTRSVDSG